MTAPLVGIVGSVAVAEKLVQTGRRLGIRFRLINPFKQERPVDAEVIQASLEDETALKRFASGLSVCTYGYAWAASKKAVRRLSQWVPVLPPPIAHETALNRVLQKQLFRSLGLLTAPFTTVNGERGLKAAIAKIGLPVVIKPREAAYRWLDLIQDEGELPAARQRLSDLAKTDRDFIVEAYLKTAEMQLVCVGVRAKDGQTGFWPIMRLVCVDEGVFRPELPVPSLPMEVAKQARTIATKIAAALGYVGTFCLEFLKVGDQIFVHALEAGPAFTGNFTQSLPATSHTENHLRAILGMELGPCE